MKNNKRTLVFVTHSGKTTGGGELSLISTAKAAKKRGYNIHVVIPVDEGLKEKLALDGITTTVIPFSWWVRGSAESAAAILKNIIAIKKLLSLFKQLDSPIIITNTSTHPWAGFAAKILGIKHVWYIREFGDIDHGFKYLLGKNNTYKIIDNLSHAIAVNSNAVKLSVKKYINNNEKILLAYPLIEDSQSPKKIKINNSNKIKLIIIGGVTQSKGQLEAVKALSYIKNKLDKELSLDLVGPTSKTYKNEILEFMKISGIDKNTVKFHGRQSNPFKFLALSDIYIMTSQNEAFGRVTVEAMSMGVPVIGANSGGTPEIISNNITGLLYNQGDPKDLSEKIIELADNDLLREKMGKESIIRFNQKFNENSCLGAFFEELEKPYTQNKNSVLFKVYSQISIIIATQTFFYSVSKLKSACLLSIRFIKLSMLKIKRNLVRINRVFLLTVTFNFKELRKILFIKFTLGKLLSEINSSNDKETIISDCEVIVEELGDEAPADVFVKLSRAYREKGEYDNSEKTISHVISLYPENKVLLIEQISLASIAGKASNVIKFGKKIINLLGDEAPADVFVKLSRAYREKGEYDNSEKTISHALSIYRDHLGLKLESISLAIQKKEWDKAILESRKLINNKNIECPASVWLKSSYAHRKNFSYINAKKTLSDLLEKYPKKILEVNKELLLIAEETSNWEEVIRLSLLILKHEIADEIILNKKIKNAKEKINDEKKKHTKLKRLRKNEIISPIKNTSLSSMDYVDLVEASKNMNESLDWDKASKKNMRTDLVSLIVLVLDNLKLTERCIRSIYKSKNLINYELIIFNNGSNNQTIDGLRKLSIDFPDLKIIHSEKNINFALGNNTAFQYANGATCVFLNNDTYVTDFWLDELLKPFKDKSIKAIQPSLLYPDQTIQNIGIVFSKKSKIGYPLYSGHNKNEVNILQNRKLACITGACLAIKSSDYIALKGFDPTFVNGQEDTDLCLRLIKKNEYCYCTKNSIVFHDEGKTINRGRFIEKNRDEFIKRWADKITPDDYKVYEKDNFEITDWIGESSNGTIQKNEVFKPILKRAPK